MPRRWRADDEYQIIHDLLEQQRGHGAALASVQIPQPAKDTFTVAATPATTYQLTAIPYQGTGGSSLNFSLNGVELLEGVDYTVDYTTGLVTVSATLKGTPTPADVLSADYWTTGDLIALSSPVDTGVNVSMVAHIYAQSPFGSSTTASWGIAQVNDGDTLIVFLNFASAPGIVTVLGVGATWTQLQVAGPVGSYYGQLWIGVGCVAATTQQVQVGMTSASSVAFAVQTWRGYTGTVTSAIATGTSTSPSTPSVATTASGEGVAGFWAHYGSAMPAYASYTNTAGAWTSDDSVYDTNSLMRVESAHRIAAEVATQQHQGNGSSSAGYIAAAVVLT